MKRWLPVLLIIGGIACLAYGGWQLGFTQFQQNQALVEAREQISKEDMSEEVEVRGNASPTVPNEMNFNEGDVIGILDIPRLERELPIVSGTDEDELDRGVGHYTSTVLPGQDDQILLSGHRDTVFRNMGELEIGDELTVQMEYGTFTYKIYDTDIVGADDPTVIRSTAPDEILTLSTCYPFHMVGNAPERYIIYAERVPLGNDL